MIFCLVAEKAFSSSKARLPAFDCSTTICWFITATLPVSSDNTGDTIASHNTATPIRLVTAARFIESSSALHGLVYLVYLVVYLVCLVYLGSPDQVTMQPR